MIHIDNWYTSYNLVNYLYTRKTLVRGTVRPNRGVPCSLQSVILRKGESAFKRKGAILTVKYQDKKTVYVLSTADKAGKLEKIRYFGNERKSIYKPTAIENYNINMGDVDNGDQIISSINCVRKTHVWFKKIALHLILRCLINSWLLYTAKYGKNYFPILSIMLCYIYVDDNLKMLDLQF